MKLFLPLILLFLSCLTEPEVKDCAGIENGTATIDDCGLCTGGTTGNVANYLKDCSGECGGNATEDCLGECNGLADIDECGTCDIDALNNCTQDCAGIWGGLSYLDDCGFCDIDTTNDCIQDCANTWGGTLVLDECGECGGDNTVCAGCDGFPNSGLVFDCAGECDGSSVIDNCGTCDADSSNDCLQDCAGAWGGIAITDECGVCDGDNTTCSDCAGVINGTATIDDCGLCTGGTTDNVANYLKDCSGECGGDAELDCLGECNGLAVTDECDTCDNDDTNDCVQDCAGAWGGGAVEDCLGQCNGTTINDECGVCNGDGILEGECDCAGSIPEQNFDCAGNCLLDFDCAGMCFPMDSILPDYEAIYSSSEILQMCNSYNSIFSGTYDVELPANNSSFIFYNETDSDCNILISAPHSQKTWRYNSPYSQDCSNDELHSRDLRTGVIAKILNEITGCPSIVKKYKSDDPNYHHKIPECTQTDVFSDSVGELLPYKQKIIDYISQNESIKFVMDIHGWQRTGDVDMGTMYGESIESEVGQCLPSLIERILENRGISSTQNHEFSASQNESVTKFVREYIDAVVDAIQFEIESEYRSCSSSRFSELLYAFLEIIYISNYLYELNITND